MSIAHELEPLRIFDMNRGRHRFTRRCVFCHVDEAYIEVDRCPVRAAGEAGQAAVATALEVALEAELMPQPIVTPHTVTGLRQYDHLPPDEALAAAWANVGPNPEHHLGAQIQLRNSMPVVHRALLRLIEEVREREVL